MADNTTLNAGTLGDSIVTREISHAGDTSKLPGSFVMGITGSEGAYTAAAINGDATNGLDVDVTRVSGNVTVIGAGTAGTANSGVVTIQGIASMTPVQIGDNSGSITVDWNGTAPPIGAGLEATALRVTIATDSTGVISVDDNGSTISIDDGAGSITVDGTVAISGTVTTSVSGTVAVTDNSGSLTVDNGGTFAVQVDGSALTRLTDIETNTDSGAVVGNGAALTAQRVTLANDSTGIVALTTSTASIGKLASNTGVTIGAVEIAAAQTLATVTTVSTVTTCSTVTTLTGSGIAHDAADSGNPHKIGAKASTAISGVTLVANADRTDLYAGTDGVLVVRPHTLLEDIVQERTTNTDGASTAFASGLAAPGAGIRLWVTKVTIANSSSSFCTVDLRDGSAGSVLWTIPVPATGGAIERFDPPLRLSANTALAFDASAATSTLSISANGFKSKI